MDSFRAVKISASPKQMSRLRNGHRVRIMKGEGVNLIIHPSKYNHITKSFSTNKGAIIQLSPEELSANMSVEGGSIFGKKADRFAKKVLGKKAVKEIHSVAKAFQPLVNEGLDALGMMATQYGVPPEAVAALSGAAKGYIDKPSDYRGKSAGSAFGKDALMGVAKDKLTSMGTDYLKTTNPQLYSQAKDIQQQYQQAKATVNEIKKLTQDQQDAADAIRRAEAGGYGLYGSGLYAGRGYGMGGSLLSVSNHALPPALQSQNASANFHFSTQLPPHLMSMVGRGLY